MGIKTLYIVDLARPWRPIEKLDCPIIEGKKFVWAEGKRRRFLIGASAFFMETTARKRRTADLEKIVGNSYLRNMREGKWSSAFKALKEGYPPSIATEY